MLRRIASAAVAGAALLAAFGCGGGGNDASVSAGTRDRTVTPAADSSAAIGAVVGADGLRTVTYRGVQFDVPGRLAGVRPRAPTRRRACASTCTRCTWVTPAPT